MFRFKRIRIALGVLVSTIAAGSFGTLMLFLSIGSFSSAVVPYPDPIVAVISFFLLALSFVTTLIYALIIAAPVCLVAVPIIAWILERFRLFAYRHAAGAGVGLGLILGLVIAFGTNTAPIVSFFSDAPRDSQLEQLGTAASHTFLVAQFALIGLGTGLVARVAFGHPVSAKSPG